MVKHLIKGDLVESESFEKLNEYFLPNGIFCFEIEEANKNYKMNGEYLDKLNRKLDYDIFGFIWYFNKTHQKFCPNPNLENLNNSEISMSHFYYLNFKCFEISLKIKFQEKDFLLMPTKNLLGIYFNKTFDQSKVRFAIRTKKGTKKLSDGFYYRLKDKKSSLPCTYRLNFQQFEVVRDDKFEFLKKPSSLFYRKEYINDANVYLKNLIDKFENEFGVTTREIVLENEKDDDFKLEISDELFEQFCLQRQSKIEKEHYSMDANMKMYSIYSQFDTIIHDKPRFLFSISLMKRKVIISNDDNYTKLIQSILNSLSLWFSLCVLDLIIYINMLFSYNYNFFPFFINILNCLKAYLEMKMNSIH